MPLGLFDTGLPDCSYLLFARRKPGPLGSLAICTFARAKASLAANKEVLKSHRARWGAGVLRCSSAQGRAPVLLLFDQACVPRGCVPGGSVGVCG